MCHSQLMCHNRHDCLSEHEQGIDISCCLQTRRVDRLLKELPPQQDDLEQGGRDSDDADSLASLASPTAGDGGAKRALHVRNSQLLTLSARRSEPIATLCNRR